MADTVIVEPGQLEGEPFAAEQQAFERPRARLSRKYTGEFVAMYGGKVADHGPDDEDGARRMFERWGDVPFYIAKVEDTPTEHELPSPETLP